MQRFERGEGFCNRSGKYLQCVVRTMLHKLLNYPALLTVNDQRGPGEEDTGNFVGVWRKFLSSHDTIEDETRIW